MSFLSIIAQVKARPELWQSTHPFYRHRVVSAKAWKEISSELNVDVVTLRKRWKHLKDQYRKEHRRVLSKAIPRSMWAQYDDLQFLADQFPKLDMTGTSQDAEELDEISHSDSDDAPLKVKIVKKHRRVSPLKPHRVPKSNHTRGIQNLIKRTPEAGKLNLILNRLIGMEQAVETGNSSTGEMSKEDTDYTFLLSLLPMMRKLTDIQKLQFRGKINDWLLDVVSKNVERMDCTLYFEDIKPPID